jgi:hypothetical protein
MRRSRLVPQLLLGGTVLLIVTAIAVAFGAARVPTASASRSCSVATLDGSYLGNFSGTSSVSGALAYQALATFNGDGTGTASVTLMTLTSGPTSFTSVLSYALNQDCTGTVTSMRSTGQTVHYNIVVVNKGAEVDLLQTDPGSVVTGVIKAA